MHKVKVLSLLFILLLAALTLGATSVQAADADTGFIGPLVDQPCRCHTLIAAQAVDGLLYAAGDGAGAFRSEDGGVTWTAINAGLPSHRIRALAVAPAQPSTLYATIGVTPYRSDDGGERWRQVAASVVPASDGDATHTPMLLVHPTDPQIVHALSAEFFFLGQRQLLTWSTDGGATWQVSRSGGIYDLTYSPGPEISLIATVEAYPESVLEQSDDLGETWRTLGASLPAAVRHVRFADAMTGYAVDAEGRGVYHTADGAATWATINDGLRNTFVQVLFVVDADTALAATAGGALAGYDRATGQWTELASREATPFTEVSALSANASATQYYAATDRGIWTSLDEGQTWRPTNQGLTTERFAINDLAFDAANPGALWTAADEGLFARNENLTWQRIELPDDMQSVAVRAVASAAGAPDTIFVATDQQLYKSSDRGASWQERGAGIEPPLLPGVRQNGATGVTLRTVAVDPADADRVFVGSDQGLFVSEDGGASWRNVPELVQLKNWPIYPEVRQIVIDPAVPTVVYVAVRLDIGLSYQTEIFKSTDGGASWTVPSRGGAGMRTPHSVTPDPTGPNRLYGAAASGFWHSEDGGFRWTRIGRSEINFIEVVVLPSQPTTLAALTADYSFTLEPDALQLSADGGETWTLIGAELADLEFTRLFAAPDDPTAFYVGTRYGGLFRFDLRANQVYLPLVRE